MKARPVLMYLGGFAKVGGIEAFARDFLLAIADAYPERELVMWGQKANRLLEEIAASGVKIHSSPWRWGCVWNVPDFVLAPLGLAAVRRASVVIFKRPPPPQILRQLRRVALGTGRRIPFILITPYRPAEYWDDSYRPVLENFDVITVQSAEGVEDLKRIGYRGRVANIPLLPPALGEPVAYPASREGGVIRLGCLGRMAAQKNLGYLLEIYAHLVRETSGDVSYELHLFGDGAERSQLTARCAEMGLSNVTFHGEIPREQVPQVIDTCDIFLITSVTEGQCLAALEVLSRGRPLVATPVGALPEVLRQPEVGRLAPLADAAAFAAEVRGVARDIRKSVLTPQSVVAAFEQRYAREDVLTKYLDLLAETTPRPVPAKMARPLEVSIIITTKNRVRDLEQTCHVLRNLSPAPLEILITADGCTDGTVEFVQTRLPDARLFVNETGRGSIAARDRMIREARGDLLFSIDDDSYPQEPDCLATIKSLFEQHPRMAVLHFPQCTDEHPETLPRFDFGPARLTRSFSSAGAVLRRAAYLELDGFDPAFFHAYEEPDYALQCIAAGWEILYHPAVSIRHHYSGLARDERRTHQRHARNECWSTLRRCPFPQVLAVVVYRALAQFRYAWSRGFGWVLREPVWWMQAVAGLPRQLSRRSPVAWSDYRKWLEMPEIAYPPEAPGKDNAGSETARAPRMA